MTKHGSCSRDSSRRLAVLTALGTDRASLATTLLLQIGTPLATSSLLGFAGAFVVTALLYRATETRVVFPVTSLTILALVITAAGLAATGLTLPWLFRSGDPDLLHAD